MRISLLIGRAEPQTGAGIFSILELLQENALIEVVPSIEHHQQLNVVGLLDIDPQDVADFIVITGRTHGPFEGFKNLK